MSKRLGLTLALVVVCVAGIALAEKKNAIVKITRVEGAPTELVFNPAELSITRTVDWKKASDSDPKDPDPTLEFTSPDGQTMAFEMAFDTFETKENVYEKAIAPIEGLTFADQDTKRPPLLRFEWGKQQSFKGVIESVNTKYTMFLPDGTPCRATVNLKMKSASKVRTKKSEP